MGNIEDRQKDETDEAKRVIDRAAAESESIGTSSFSRIATKSRKHLMADDVDQSDSVEVWGTRIGRILGLCFLIALIIYLSVTYL